MDRADVRGSGIFQRARQIPHGQWRDLGLLVLAFALLSAGYGNAVSGLSFGVIWPPVTGGVILGWGLAASGVSRRSAGIISLALGLAFITVQIGNLIPPLVALIVSLFDYARAAVTQGALPAAAPIESAWSTVLGPVAVLVARLADWFSALFQGEPAFDPVATTMVWMGALWGTAIWAGWFVRRRKAVIAGFLPALMLLAGSLTVAGGSTFFLAAGLAPALILKATSAQATQEGSWRREKIDFSGQFSRSVTWTALGLAFVLVIVALITPSISVRQLVDSIRDLSQDQREGDVARSLGLEAEEGKRAEDVFLFEREGGLPARHLIGSGPELSEQVVMNITVERPPDLADELRYWRGITYDRYTGVGWETRGTATVAYQAGEKAAAISDGWQLVRQEVRILDLPGPVIYAAGIPVTVDRDFQVAWRVRYRGTETYDDFFAASLVKGDTGVYRADSLVSNFDGAGLRGASREIPEWVAEHYLALPENISNRVLALARDLTASEPTPYDRALAIEGHLRQYPYTLDLPPPPADWEIADYFLFDIRRGYCDYYATAMVVLARAAGLPARLATGFISGDYDADNRRFQVTADLAHSWPEIYFSGYGWIPFEPTAGRAPIERQINAAPAAGPELDLEREMEPITAARYRARWRLALRFTGGLIIVAGLLALGWWLLDIWRLALLSPEQAIVRLFRRFQGSGRGLGLQQVTGETPHEFASRVSQYLGTLARDRRGAAALTSAPAAVDWLTALYTRSLFSPYEPGAKTRTKAIQIWSRLRIQLLWATLLGHTGSLIDRVR